MASDDPFFSPQSDDRTIIRPVPGGKRSDIKTSSSARVSAPDTSKALPILGQLNPLERAASGLLALITQINGSQSQSDPVGLKNKIIHEIKKFERSAETEDVDIQTISSTRYVMCTVLDEAVLSTPWGTNSDWAQHSLLSLFHKEVSGGERFFQLLKSLAQNPAKNRGLLEVMYLCLALGFEGRYRIIDGGKNKLASIREWLYQTLQQERGILEYSLSPHWEGVTDQRNPLARFIPLWVFGAIAAGLLGLMFSVFLFQLNRDSDPVFRQIFSLKLPVTEIVEIEPEPIYTPVPELTLSMLLADEIELKHLKVAELVQRSVVTIQGDNLFASGSATVKRSLIPLLHRIADALNQLSGQVLITGHSDNVPIRSSRYPSNWHLSKARAKSVARLINHNLTDQDRAIIEGRSDLDPIAPNTTRKGRAKNRRVEVTLLK
jgi:type VI secretion system protein ImpK